ncbi:MAG: hypothetical protein EPO00_07115 [Chloroflexota bacterium]|nr:MAG: hypothetical protein EPO00_07115 [Chloroflexota bacterium]
MSADEIRHVALPKLYGGPAYARPVVLIESSERPFDPDELPLVVAMTDEERAIIDEDRRLAAQDVAPPPPTLQSKPFSLRDLSSRFLGGRESSGQ